MNRLMTLFIVCLTAMHVSAQWTDAMYNRYTWRNYTDYAPFNQSVQDSDIDADLLEAAIFYETNRQRVSYGLPELAFDHALNVCAHNHSADMVKHRFFSHTGPVPGKKTPADRLTQVGYTNCYSAENIAYAAANATYAAVARYVVEDLWMNSAGHRKNILSSRYTHLGCGVAFYYDNGVLMYKATQNFLLKDVN